MKGVDSTSHAAHPFTKAKPVSEWFSPYSVSIVAKGRNKMCLSKAEEHKLIQKAQGGDFCARDQLVKTHIAWIKFLAGMMCQQRNCRHLFNDLVHEGKTAFLLAIERFDFNKARSEMAASNNMTRLTTFAYKKIKGAMINFLEKEKLIHIPRDAQKMARQLETISRQLRQKFQREPTDEEIAQEMGLSISDLHTLLSMPNLYENIDGIGEGLEPASQSKTPEEETIEWEKKQKRAEIVMATIEKLPSMQKRAVKLQIYEGYSVKEIAKLMASNENAVKQLLHKARQNLSQNKELQKLSIQNGGDTDA